MTALRPLLEFRHISLYIGEKTVLKNIDWRCERGQNWAILGANGSGKTSLLSILMGYTPFSSGELLFCGEEYGKTDWTKIRHEIGLVSHAVAGRIPGGESCLETVVSGQFSQIGLWIREVDPDVKRALNCLSLMGIRKLCDRSWRNLSQGEQQKVAIARMLMLKPKLLVLDEPCAGLDPVARVSFLERIEGLVNRKRAPQVLLVTHHIEEIIPSISHVLVLRGGRVVAQGPKSDVLNSDVLSEAYGRPLHVRHHKDRQRWELEL